MTETKQGAPREGAPLENFRPERSDTNPANANQAVKVHFERAVELLEARDRHLPKQVEVDLAWREHDRTLSRRR
jgi:hypothetical protein